MMEQRIPVVKPGVHILRGNEAIARAAIVAGCRFYAGYPITPSSDLMEEMARLLPKVGGVFIQAEDEIAAINMVLGASAAGLKSMTATSGPGLSLMEEALGLGFMLELPAVIVDVMRVGPATGIPTLGSQGDIKQLIWGSHGDRETVVFAPSSVQEAFDLTIEAFNVAEDLRIPVIIASDEFIAHTYSRLKIPNPEDIVIRNRRTVSSDVKEYRPFDNSSTDVPPFAPPGLGFRFHMTGLVHDDRGYPVIDKHVTEALLKRLIDKVRRRRRELFKFEYDEKIKEREGVLLIAYGSIASIARLAVEKLRRDNINVGLLRPKVLWPIDEEALCRIIDSGYSSIAVIEMNLYGQYDVAVRASISACKSKPKVKFVSVTPGFYPSPTELYVSVKRVIEFAE